MKTMLNAILRGLMRRSDAVGKVYTGTKLVETVQPKTSTIVSSVIVPPGTYVITANTEWLEDLNAFTVSNIGGIGFSVIERGTMGGGGGSSLAAIEAFNKETVLHVGMYHSHTESVGIRVVLRAIRIK